MTDPKRKLAAIVFTDIVGFTKLTAANQSKASSLLKQQRELLRPIVESFNGSWIKEMGDGLLLIFDTVTDAVNCSIKIQEEAKPVADLDLRIGIHQGEILLEENDVIGDDVNIAARIEPFSATGGIAISNKVNDALVRESEFETKYLGKPKLKGVGQKVEVFCITSHNLPQTELSKVSAKLEPEGFQWNVKNSIGVAASVIGLFLIINLMFLRIGFADLEDTPSIAILPFENKGAAEDEFYAYGISADLISDVASAGLIRVAGLNDIEKIDHLNMSYTDLADKLFVRYIAKGTLWKMDSLFQLSLELYDTKDSKVAWSNRWQTNWKDLATIKDDLADNILKNLDISIIRNVEQVAVANNPEAYEYYLKAKYKYEKRENMEDTEIARGFLNKAIEMDEKIILANHLLGETYRETGEYDKALEIFTKNFKQAIELDNKVGLAKSLTGIGLIHWRKGELDKALENYNKSYDVYDELGDKKGMGVLLNNIAIIYNRQGDREHGLEYYNRSLTIAEVLDDKIQMGKVLNNIGNVHTYNGDYELALDYQFRSLKLKEEAGNNRGIGFGLGNIGRIYYLKGDYEQALDYQNRSLKVREKLGDKSGIALSLYNIGTIHKQIYEFEKALDIFSRCLNIATEIGEKGKLAYSQLFIGDIHRIKGENEKSIEFLGRSIKLIEELGRKNTLTRLIKKYGIVYYQQNDYAKALENLERSATMQMEDKEAISLETNTYLFLTYKQLGKSYDPKEVIEKIEDDSKDYELNFRLYQLLEDRTYLEAAYNQVEQEKDALDGDIRVRFLGYPIPKAIIQEWERVS